jgi:hypothetical protein
VLNYEEQRREKQLTAAGRMQKQKTQARGVVKRLQDMKRIGIRRWQVAAVAQAAAAVLLQQARQWEEAALRKMDAAHEKRAAFVASADKAAEKQRKERGEAQPVPRVQMARDGRDVVAEAVEWEVEREVAPYPMPGWGRFRL